MGEGKWVYTYVKGVPVRVEIELYRYEHRAGSATVWECQLLIAVQNLNANK